MEIEGSDGSKIFLKPGSELEWGRGTGFKIDDRTVSRRHLEFLLSIAGEPRVRFLVHGKNPIWVHRSKSGEVITFKTSESGEMEIGDAFCVSAKNPIWFTCKQSELEAGKTDNERRELGLAGELAESLSGGFEVKGFDSLEPESVDISHIDPVKEFGFLVIGEEFNGYPKRMIKDIKNWDWFLEEPGEEGSQDDELGDNKRKKGGRRKRKKGGDGEIEDEDWSGESEDEKELISKAIKSQKPKYSTRSKDNGKGARDAGQKNNASSVRKKATPNAEVDEDDDDETLGGFIVDDDDETLGGFIVDDEDLEEEGEELEEEELDD